PPNEKDLLLTGQIFLAFLFQTLAFHHLRRGKCCSCRAIWTEGRANFCFRRAIWAEGRAIFSLRRAIWIGCRAKLCLRRAIWTGRRANSYLRRAIWTGRRADSYLRRAKLILWRLPIVSNSGIFTVNFGFFQI